MAVLQRVSLISPNSQSHLWAVDVILVRVLGTGSLSRRFLMSSKVFASYISDEARSLLASLSSDLFLISSLGALLLQPQKVISVAQSHLSVDVDIDACTEGSSMLSRQQ